jgi:hypothetical protein
MENKAALPGMVAPLCVRAKKPARVAEAIGINLETA